VGLIRWGTRPDQEELFGSLGTIVAQVEETQFEAPAIAVIGDVVQLHHVLSAVAHPKIQN
jgi:uroporphyrin-III C-methyltransferase